MTTAILEIPSNVWGHKGTVSVELQSIGADVVARFHFDMNSDAVDFAKDIAAHLKWGT